MSNVTHETIDLMNFGRLRKVFCLDSIKAQNMSVVRFTSVVARYVMIQHSADVGNPYNSKR